jgi:small conductance mechanosensitive channel
MDPIQLGIQANTFLAQLTAWALVVVPSFLGAIVVLILGWWFAGWAERAVRRMLERQVGVEVTLRGVISSIVRYAILVMVLVAVLGQLGVQTTSILAALGAIGLAIGLALQGTLSNIAAGMMLLWLRPFRVGDSIDTGAVAGTVQELGLFASQLHTWDGVYLFVPNSQLWNVRIVNYSRLPTRLVDLKFGIGYGDDVEKGRQTLLHLAASDSRVLADPPPQFFVEQLGDSAVILCLRAWAANAEYWNVRRDLTERGKLALEAAGLTLPFPQHDVHLHAMSRAPEPEAA